MPNIQFPFFVSRNAFSCFIGIYTGSEDGNQLLAFVDKSFDVCGTVNVSLQIDHFETIPGFTKFFEGDSHLVNEVGG